MQTSTTLEQKLNQAGSELYRTLKKLLDGIPEGSQGPQRLGTALDLDKVLAHRILKTVKDVNPLAVLQHAPGPDPMRRFVRAAKKNGASLADTKEALLAIDQFHGILREDIGDRSQLDAILSAWLPGSRSEFELRRKQSVFKARSQLLGISAATNLATVILHPSTQGDGIDVVWLAGLYGLRRLRPGARTKLTTRRFVVEGADRRPTTLGGERVECLEGLRLDAFCSAQPAELEVNHVGEKVQYLLAGEDFGKKAISDLLLAEVNYDEMPRTPKSGRRPYVFAEIATPTKLLLFDVLVHKDLYPGATPELGTYDTAFDGVVDVNDPSREIDRIDSADRLEMTGRGIEMLPSPEIPMHGELIKHVFESLAWNPDSFRGWRARIDYPLYGAQVAVSFDTGS
jgi:hypothetical protein